MNINENSTQRLILSSTPWGWPIIGVLIAGVCFSVEPGPMTNYPLINRLILIFVGLLFLGLCTLAIRKLRIHFDREAGTITRITEPLLPLGSIHIFRPRSETRPIGSVLFAYAERQKKSSQTAQSSYSLAIATGPIPDEILRGDSAFVFEPEMEKVRWLVGHNAGMKKTKADEIITTVNKWLGTEIPHKGN